MRRNDETPGPTRLTAVGATDLERRLLDAAAREQPSPELQRRMRQALGLAVGGATAAAAAPAAAKAGAAGAAHWLATGLIAAAVAGGAVSWMALRPSPPAAPAASSNRPAAPVAPPPAQASVEPATTSVAPVPAPAAPLAARHRAPAPSAAPSAAADLRGEIALMDSARIAIRTGAPERALTLLDRYRASYPAGTLGPEAAVLRIEALHATGRADEARALARAFLAKHPDSPLAERVSKL